MKLDLHVHSTRSDGKYPPAEVLRMAARAGLDAVAIADHDLGPEIQAGTQRVDDRELRLIAAAEMSGHHDGHEYHLLVYFPGSPPAEATAFLRARAAARAVRFDAAMARLGEAARAPAEAVRGEVSLTRFHMAQALEASGRARRPHDAWRLLGADVVPLVDLAFVDAIRLARSWGALTSWAHPPLADAQRHVAEFVSAGLQGLEGCRPHQDRGTRNGLARLARRYHLLVTGGSDWHGWWEGEFGLFRFEHEGAERFLERLDAAQTA